MSKLSSKLENELSVKKSDPDSLGVALKNNNICCSEQKLIPCSFCSSSDKICGDNILNNSSNSYSISENNDLFQSLINSKNGKNKEFSLLYLINTFGKSFSNESNQKNNIVVDLPKISKNLFSKSQSKSFSSKNLDNVSIKKNLPLRKCISKGGPMNNFFTSIYEKQMSSGKLIGIDISGKKSSKKSMLHFNNGNKNNEFFISSFSRDSIKFGGLFNDNKGIKFENGKLINNNYEKKNNLFNSSLLKVSFEDENKNNNIEES